MIPVGNSQTLKESSIALTLNRAISIIKRRLAHISNSTLSYDIQEAKAIDIVLSRLAKNMAENELYRSLLKIEKTQEEINED